jgi:hypothetical protein
VRDSIGGAWLFGLVAIFIVIFSSFLAITINYHRANLFKNDLVSMIERSEGFNEVQVDEFLDALGVRTIGNCPTEPTDLNRHPGSEIIYPTSPGRARYCIERIPVFEPPMDVPKAFFRVIVFFRIDLPVIGNVLTIRVPGQTRVIWFAN